MLGLGLVRVAYQHCLFLRGVQGCVSVCQRKRQGKPLNDVNAVTIWTHLKGLGKDVFWVVSFAYGV